MDEGISCMAMQQGGLGLILTVLIMRVPEMTAQFFMGALGQFMHYSSFGALGGTNNQPGPRGELPGSYQAPTESGNQTRGNQPPNTRPNFHNTPTHHQGTGAQKNQDVIKSERTTERDR